MHKCHKRFADLTVQGSTNCQNMTETLHWTITTLDPDKCLTLCVSMAKRRSDIWALVGQ